MDFAPLNIYAIPKWIFFSSQNRKRCELFWSKKNTGWASLILQSPTEFVKHVGFNADPFFSFFLSLSSQKGTTPHGNATLSH